MTSRSNRSSSVIPCAALIGGPSACSSGASAFVAAQRAAGTDVSDEIVEGGRHGSVAFDEFGRTLEWLVERFAPR